MKHLKRLGLPVVAAMALVAFVGAGSASAATSFTASATGKKLTNSTIEKEVWTITGSNTECSNVTFTGVTEGTASGGLGFTSTGLKVTPKWEGCAAFGFAATVTNNGCDTLTTAGGLSHLTPETCTLTFVINNIFAKCHVEITGGQTIGGSTYSNAVVGIIVAFNMGGIKAHVTQSSGLCPLTVGTHEMTLKGKTEFRAEGANIAVD